MAVGDRSGSYSSAHTKVPEYVPSCNHFTCIAALVLFGRNLLVNCLLLSVSPIMGSLLPIDPNDMPHSRPSRARKVVIFSGGTAANSLVDVFEEVIENNSCSLTHIIPISDNGGSSSELIRVFGGPGIGDIRSECTNFIL